MIKKEDGKWFVYDKTGTKKLSKGYESEGEAKQRLGQIEAIKANVLMINSTVNKSQVTLNGQHWEIKRVPFMRDDIVMNSIRYPRSENQKGFKTYLNKLSTMGHPTDESGSPISASDVDAVVGGFPVGKIVNAYEERGQYYADLRINRATLQSANGGAEIDADLSSGDPVGVSCGLQCLPVIANADGIPDATNQIGDHIALLPRGVTPAGHDFTRITVNGESEEAFVVNVDFDKFVEQSLQEESKLAKIINEIASVFGLTRKDASSIVNEEGDAMREMLINKLQEKGITVNAEISDEELMAAYNEAMMKDKKPDMTDEERAAKDKEKNTLESKMNSLEQKLETLTNALQANSDKALADKREMVVNADVGFDAESVKDLSEASLDKLIAKHAPVVGNAFGGYQTNKATEEEVF